jgi:hypothetical protein
MEWLGVDGWWRCSVMVAVYFFIVEVLVLMALDLITFKRVDGLFLYSKGRPPWIPPFRLRRAVDVGLVVTG